MGKLSEGSKGRNLGLRVEKSLAQKTQKKRMNNLPQAPGENRPTESKESPTVKTNTDSTMVRKDMGLSGQQLTKGGTNCPDHSLEAGGTGRGASGQKVKVLH